MGANDVGRVLVVEDWESPKWRLNSGIYKIIDKHANVVPFKMTAEQEDFFDRMWFWSLILKSRQHGFTTFAALIELDQAVFTCNFSGGMIAQTKEDARELFDKKIQWPYEQLPEPIRRACPQTRDAAGVLMLANGSRLYVDNSMRGGTLQMLHISELGKLAATRPDIAKEIKTGALNTLASGTRLTVESTAEGAEGLFYEWATDAQKAQQEGRKLSKKAFKFFFYAWFLDPANEMDPEGVDIGPYREYFENLLINRGIYLTPRKKAWYAETARIQKEDMKREHPSTPEEAFAASMEGVVFADEMRFLREENRITDVPWDPKVPVNVGFDLGTRGKTSMVVHQRNGLFHDLVDHHSETNKGVDHFCDLLRQQSYSVGTIYLPHDGNTTLQGRQIFTRAELFREAMPGVDVVIVPKIKTIQDGIATTRPFIRQTRIDRTRCSGLIHSLDHYKYAWDERLAGYSKTPLENGPDHDVDALRQLAQFYKSLERSNKPGGKVKRKRRSWRS